jgi:hypothetical protein
LVEVVEGVEVVEVVFREYSENCIKLGKKNGPNCARLFGSDKET